jgi:hypothetical protein
MKPEIRLCTIKKFLPEWGVEPNIGCVMVGSGTLRFLGAVVPPTIDIDLIEILQVVLLVRVIT